MALWLLQIKEGTAAKYPSFDEDQNQVAYIIAAPSHEEARKRASEYYKEVDLWWLDPFATECLELIDPGGESTIIQEL